MLRLLRRATRLSITISPAAMQPSMACIASLMPRLCSLSIILTEAATSPATSAIATAFHETLASTCGEAVSSDGEDMAPTISYSAAPGQLSQLHSLALHVPVSCLLEGDASGDHSAPTVTWLQSKVSCPWFKQHHEWALMLVHAQAA